MFDMELKEEKFGERYNVGVIKRVSLLDQDLEKTNFRKLPRGNVNST